KPNQKIHVDKLQATLSKLEQLDVKQKEELTLRESIYLLRDKLRAALKKGYSYEDLSEILEAQGILVSAATLKQYLTESKKEVTKGKNRASTGKPGLNSPKATQKNIKEPQENITKNKDKDSAVESESEVEEKQSLNKADDTETLSNGEVNLLEPNNQASSVESQQDNKKPVRGKSKKPSSSSKDLSSEFNQY
ncbi:MAG TPA: hypothetical protein DEV81_09155, partial [Cyanobacteria bacterium UBA11049]|nr:hypothetical protein [Cyanobacteria bacterium UBA11049]